MGPASRASIACLLATVVAASTFAEGPEDAARGLLTRLLPDHADLFVFETIPAENGLDVFEVEGRDDTIVLRGSTGVAMASALNHYLEN